MTISLVSYSPAQTGDITVSILKRMDERERRNDIQSVAATFRKNFRFFFVLLDATNITYLDNAIKKVYCPCFHRRAITAPLPIWIPYKVRNKMCNNSIPTPLVHWVHADDNQSWPSFYSFPFFSFFLWRELVVVVHIFIYFHVSFFASFFSLFPFMEYKGHDGAEGKNKKDYKLMLSRARVFLLWAWSAAVLSNNNEWSNPTTMEQRAEKTLLLQATTTMWKGGRENVS